MGFEGEENKVRQGKAGGQLGFHNDISTLAKDKDEVCGLNINNTPSLKCIGVHKGVTLD